MLPVKHGDAGESASFSPAHTHHSQRPHAANTGQNVYAALVNGLLGVRLPTLALLHDRPPKGFAPFADGLKMEVLEVGP